MTAQRREQKLQDVGISVTPLSAEAVRDLNITTATDIVRAVPSLKMNAYSSAQVVFNIRGVSQNDYGDQQEPPVAVYQDDSYSSSINLASFPVFDLARVETLRGPQGTLFGRNATGGAIQFISHKPTREFEGYTDLTVGRFSQFILDGAMSGPISDNLQGRLAFIRNKDDGYMNSIVPGVPDRGGNDHYALRGSLAWQPSEATNVNLITRYMRADKETQAGLYSHEPACPNARIPGRVHATDSSLRILGHGPGRHGTGFRDDCIIPSRGGDPWSTAETAAFLRGPQDLRAHVRVDHDFGDLDFTSISDYQTSEQVLHRGRRRLARSTACSSSRAATRPDLAGIPPSAGPCGAHEMVGGLFYMDVDGDYTGKFADPFYGYDPDVAFSQQHDFLRRLHPGRVELQRPMEADRRPALLA